MVVMKGKKCSSIEEIRITWGRDDVSEELWSACAACEKLKRLHVECLEMHPKTV